MNVTLTSLADLADLPFDQIIDVRSPAEWAEDHIPGAINLPVLDDAERARVGTIYKQESPFLARKIGGALVAQNAARHLMGPLADKPGSYRPLVYCWRGGQRSGSFASILEQIGWRVGLISGGYKTYRRLVVKAVYDAPFPAPVVILDGNTGTAKTDILAGLSARGVQVIDLEGLAHHRGSVFGGRAGGQPSQKAFEGAIARAIAGLDTARPGVVEAESSKIGALIVPPALWKAMSSARRLIVAAPLAARAAYLTRAYADILADRAALARILDGLRPLHPAEVIDAWLALAALGDDTTLAADLMARHYDPRYARHRARMGGEEARFDLPDLAPGTLERLADDIARHLAPG
ncbi:MAG: tRNA 2-selenouridine(34) synthase MnmH [Rhodobacteraceae bacterium]|nr:tRNA 2-selenouridine(34) synthase MnmH [Paracoccaceae bacterium]